MNNATSRAARPLWTGPESGQNIWLLGRCDLSPALETLGFGKIVSGASYSSKPKIDACIRFTPARDLSLRFAYTLKSRALLLNSRTSSPDQKRSDFRQKISTMLGLFVEAS